MPLTVRQAGPADAPVVVEFNRLLALESEGKTLNLETLEPGVDSVLGDVRKGYYFVAELDGRIVGQIGLTFEWSDWRNGWFWWIQSVYVRKEARRQGVFSGLYAHVEEMARRDPAVIGLRLYVEEENKSAQATYLSLGMERTGYFVLEKFPLGPIAAVAPKDSPKVFVLAGSNGAGKTTAARTLLAERMKLMTFVNADVIAQGIGGFNPDTVAAEAGRIMLTRLDELAAERANFALETTLSGLTLAGWLERLRQTGYNVVLAYFWLADADLAVARVAERVRKGGHHVPEDTIRRRYKRSIQNFFSRYRPVVNSWEVYANFDQLAYELIAHGSRGAEDNILNAELWEQFRRNA